MIDYTTLTDTDFQEHCSRVYAEQERRSKLASIPESIKQLANDFASFGGDKEDLVDKINATTESEE